jgi:hypothetical protein
MLTGPELLAKVKELGDANKSELVRETGYVKENGRLCYVDFYHALLEAKGFAITKNKGSGRRLSYKTKVQFNGKIQIGDGYIREMGFEPGVEFDIKLGKNSITLSPAPAV